MNLRNLLLKATALFVLFNVIYYVVQPLNLLNRLTVYNTLVPGRLRFPFSESSDVSYSLIVTNIDQMLASHVLARPKAADEFRVLMIGDSAVWGYLLEPTQSQAECLNAMQLTTPSGRKVRVYNLGYPTLTVMKDLLVLRHALPYQPDLIIWPTTLASLYPSDQLDFEVIKAHYDETAALIKQHNFLLYQTLTPPTWLDRTIFGQRRSLADWLRYQLYGFGWAATGIDHRLPKFVTPHPSQYGADDGILSVGMMHLKTPRKMSVEDLSFDIVKVGIETAKTKGVPVLLINEPMYRSSTSELRWNFYYPKWAYDTYRDSFREVAQKEGWRYLDLWDAAPPDRFTDTDFHLTATASCEYAAKLREPILSAADSAVKSYTR